MWNGHTRLVSFPHTHTHTHENVRGRDFVGLTQPARKPTYFRESFLGRVVYFGFYINLDSKVVSVVSVDFLTKKT